MPPQREAAPAQEQPQIESQRHAADESCETQTCHIAPAARARELRGEASHADRHSKKGEWAFAVHLVEYVMVPSTGRQHNLADTQ